MLLFSQPFVFVHVFPKFRHDQHLILKGSFSGQTNVLMEGIVVPLFLLVQFYFNPLALLKILRQQDSFIQVQLKPDLCFSPVLALICGGKCHYLSGRDLDSSQKECYSVPSIWKLFLYLLQPEECTKNRSQTHKKKHYAVSFIPNLKQN